MKKLPLLFTLFFCAASTVCLALDPAGWQFRQTFDVAQGGPLRVSVPADTLGGAQPDLCDLRIVGPDGAELPYTFLELPAERAAFDPIKTLRRPVSLRVDPAKKEIIVTIETGTDDPLESVELVIPDTKDYLLPARVDISGDGQKWETLSSGQVLFRRSQGVGRYDAVVQNTFSLNRRAAAWARVTISFDTDPVAVSGAMIRTVTGTPGRAAMPDEDVPARIVKTERRPGETWLTIDLGAANLSISKLAFSIQDPLFMRSVSMMRETGDGGKQAPMRTGVIYRVEVENQIAARKTELDIGGIQIPAKQMIVRIENGDSPPLDVRSVSVKRRPVHVAFNPPVAGTCAFLSGNKAAAASSYDLAALSGRLASLPLARITAGAVVETPNYVAPKPPGEPGAFAMRAVFWLALAVVVIVLLVVVAKLLPKPKG
jgi:hypothetical protein